MAALSIVIVSYNSKADLDPCLASLVRHPLRDGWEIVVVDNASPDGTAAWLRERWPHVRLIEAGGNLGFARATNLGIRETSGEYVLLLNPDTAVPPGALDRLVAALAAQTDVAVAGPRLVDAHGRAELSFGRMISPLAELRQKLLVAGNAREIGPVRALVEAMTRRTRPVDWVSGACLLIRRTDLEAAGLLDERFFMYAEDVDLCATVRARGRTVLFVADVQVVHLRGRSAASAPAATADAYRRSQIAFYEKHHPGWAPLLKAYLKVRGRSPDNPAIR
jgi:GT2 family glycosyltransferase